MTDHGHGHYLTYTYHRCRCERCTRAWNVYSQGIKLRHQRGEVVSVPRATVRAYIRRLMEQTGATRQGIARAAGYGNNQPVVNALDESKTRPVPASAARRLMAVTFDSLPDDAQVWGRLATVELDRLEQHGVTRHGAGRLLGWGSWPGDAAWPKTRVQAVHVRTLRAEADRLDSACEDCGAPGWAGGRWCLDCFTARAKPSRPTGCGTDAGYARHRRAKEPACPACHEAHRLANQIRSAA